MNPRLFEAALKRERLIERIGNQRQRLITHSSGVERLCASADRALAAADKVRDHPQWVIAAVAALVAIRPRRAWRLARSAFVLWRVWSAIRRRLPAAAAG